MTFKNYKKKNYFLDFIVYQWLGPNEQAQNHRVFVYFLFPSLGAFLLFVIVPFVQGVYLSFTDWNGLNTGHETFLGLDNYKEIFSETRFLFSFWRTIIYSVLNIIAINLVAFGLALLVTQNLKGKNVYRAGFFLPNLIGGLVLGYIWQFIYNKAIVSLGGAFETSILLGGQSALYGLLIVVTWQYAGYIMMIYIAAIQNIPQDLVEAATIDGANAIQRLRAITMPLVAQAFTVAMFLTLITSFKQFDTVVSLTQGGPSLELPSWFGSLLGLDSLPVVQSTNLVSINIYNTAFSSYELGIGQAKAIVFFAFLLIISMVQVYFNKKREVEL
ncbi:MAG: sugar ABC transporter permease [Firmicutes bacterium]|nr:sugar ABC transporter permease [Bacillota bacterium]